MFTLSQVYPVAAFKRVTLLKWPYQSLSISFLSGMITNPRPTLYSCASDLMSDFIPFSGEWTQKSRSGFWMCSFVITKVCLHLDSSVDRAKKHVILNHKFILLLPIQI